MVPLCLIALCHFFISFFFFLFLCFVGKVLRFGKETSETVNSSFLCLGPLFDIKTALFCAVLVLLNLCVI